MFGWQGAMMRVFSSLQTYSHRILPHQSTRRIPSSTITSLHKSPRSFTSLQRCSHSILPPQPTKRIILCILLVKCENHIGLVHLSFGEFARCISQKKCGLEKINNIIHLHFIEPKDICEKSFTDRANITIMCIWSRVLWRQSTRTGPWRKGRGRHPPMETVSVVPGIPAVLTGRTFSLCAKLVGHLPVYGWIQAAVGVIKRRVTAVT